MEDKRKMMAIDKLLLILVVLSVLEKNKRNVKCESSVIFSLMTLSILFWTLSMVGSFLWPKRKHLHSFSRHNALNFIQRPLPSNFEDLISCSLHQSMRLYMQETGTSLEVLMEEELHRLSTYFDFPKDCPVSSILLAAAGFYHACIGTDEVICFKCGIVLKGWKKGDDPLQIHKDISPNCKFIKSKLSTEGGYTLGLHVLERCLRHRADIHGTQPGTYGHDVLRRGRNSDDNPFNELARWFPRSGFLGFFKEGVFKELINYDRLRTETEQDHNNEEELVQYLQSLLMEKERQKPTSDQSSATRNSSNSPEPPSATASTTIPPAIEPLREISIKPKYPNFAVYGNRLKTYKFFPKDLNQKPEDLAKAGFFYNGINDHVRCFYCGGGLRNWEPEDDVWVEHARWYPKCVYVRQSKGDEFIRLVRSGRYKILRTETEQDHNNLEELMQYLQSLLKKKECQKPTSDRSSATQNSSNSTEPPCATASTAIPPAVEPQGVTTIKPKYPNFAAYVNRLQTYKGFPKDLNQKPEDLAKAGFFYEGKSDNVRCFYCGGGLRDWEPEDDVWIEHARWYPKCVYVRQSKGDEFIRLVHSGQYEILKKERELKKAAEQKKKEVMRLPAVVSVIEMGYHENLVKQAYQKCATEHRDGNVTAVVLIQMVWQLEEEGQTNLVGEGEASASNENDLAPSDTKKQANTKSLAELLEENRILKEQTMCKICMQEKREIVFFPCGHMITCAVCSAFLTHCPLCKRFIRRSIKVCIF